MARRDLNLDEEKRSYAGLWLLGAALLVVGSIWAILDDSFLRRPWKAYQRAFFRVEEDRARDSLRQEEEKLANDPAYVEAEKALAEANRQIESGESAKKLADAQDRLSAAKLDEYDADLKVRFVKSELEEAWYEYDHAIESGGDVEGARKRRDELAAERVELEARWAKTQQAVAAIDAEIGEIRAPAKSAEAKLKELAAERERIATRIDGMKSVVANLEVSRIPTIEQIVLPDFDLNNFEEPVARVDRCTSCHAAIAKPGFEDLENPMQTHPKLELFLGKHPPDKFGCTPCHEGQGVALNSVRQAHGNVQFWEHPLLLGDEQQARCLGCHVDVSLLEGADTLRRGEYLFEQLGCHGCHLVQGYDGLPQVGPNLRRVAAKVNPQWLVSWVKNPYDFRPRTRMPNFLFDDAQATAVAAYIWSSSKQDGEAWLAQHPDPGGIDPSDADLVARGKAVFDSVGCRACHAIEENEIATPLGAVKDWGPNLRRVGEKTNARFIYWWVKNPHDYSPKTFMPSLRLADDEARSVAAYLVSLSAGAPAEATVTAASLEDPQLVEQGKAIVRKYGCYACHAINGMDQESRIGVELSTFGGKVLEELYFGSRTEIPRNWNDWTYWKLKNPRIYATEHVEQLMPNFNLAEEDVIALRVWLKSRVERVPPEEWQDPQNDPRLTQVRDGRRVIEFHNCQGCHVIDDKGGYVRRLYEENPTLAPPILNGEGAKVQPQWLYGFLQDPARQPLRIWLKIRMPTFGFDGGETTRVVDYFTAAAELDDPYFFWDPAIDSTPQQIAAGKLLMSTEYFACFACHVRGNETPAGPPEQWAPNLAYARERLNPHWILAWIKDPQALMPGTKMPAFYEAGQAGPEDVFGGNTDEQIAAMRDYIMSLGWSGPGTQSAGTEKPAAAPAATSGVAADGRVAGGAAGGGS
jgi:mono/diheme cytochrome c family protein